jgi:hypothetical protein
MGTAVSGVSCGAPTRCVEVDQAGNAVVFDGSTWAAPQAVTPGHALSSVSCVGTGFCLAVGENFAVTYDGGSWSAPTTVAPQAGLATVSCASTTSCTAADFAGYVYSWDGSQWSPATDLRITNAALTSISCPTASFCAVTEPYAGPRTESAGGWSAVDPDLQDALSVGCAAPAFCVAGGAAGELYSYNGTRWASEGTGLGGTGNVTGASCGSTALCMATFYNGNLTYFDGLDWWGFEPGAPVLNEQDRATYVSCAGPTLCMLVGSGGGIASAGRG